MAEGKWTDPVAGGAHAREHDYYLIVHGHEPRPHH
jgi:hypothetical protein